MTDRPIIRFIKKTLLFTIPIWLVLLLYAWLDPFKVVQTYDAYFISGGVNPIVLNKDFVSTRNWQRHYPRYQYDSYIFGSSRSMFYQVAAWSKHLHTDPEHCYHFDASGETLFGIAKKIAFLQKRKVRLRNALLVMDASLLKEIKNSTGHLYIKDPLISCENALTFQVTSLQAFLNINFLKAYTDYKLSGKVKEYMTKELLMNDITGTYDPITNEVQEKDRDDLIRTDPEKYYGPIARIFYPRDSIEKTAPPVIGEEQLKLLKDIAGILKSQATDYKIVISPLYEQKKLNPADRALLENIFGAATVYDFSGINTFTVRRNNYYEPNHYLPTVAAAIMDSIYLSSLHDCP